MSFGYRSYSLKFSFVTHYLNCTSEAKKKGVNIYQMIPFWYLSSWKKNQRSHYWQAFKNLISLSLFFFFFALHAHHSSQIDIICHVTWLWAELSTTGQRWQISNHVLSGRPAPNNRDDWEWQWIAFSSYYIDLLERESNNFTQCHAEVAN